MFAAANNYRSSESSRSKSNRSGDNTIGQRHPLNLQKPEDFWQTSPPFCLLPLLPILNATRPHGVRAKHFGTMMNMMSPVTDASGKTKLELHKEQTTLIQPRRARCCIEEAPVRKPGCSEAPQSQSDAFNTQPAFQDSSQPQKSMHTNFPTLKCDHNIKVNMI